MRARGCLLQACLCQGVRDLRNGKTYAPCLTFSITLKSGTLGKWATIFRVRKFWENTDKSGKRHWTFNVNQKWNTFHLLSVFIKGAGIPSAYWLTSWSALHSPWGSSLVFDIICKTGIWLWSVWWWPWSAYVATWSVKKCTFTTASHFDGYQMTDWAALSLTGSGDSFWLADSGVGQS